MHSVAVRTFSLYILTLVRLMAIPLIKIPESFESVAAYTLTYSVYLRFSWAWACFHSTREQQTFKCLAMNVE